MKMYVFFLLCSLPTDAQEAQLSRRHQLNLKYLLKACSALGTGNATVEKELCSVGLEGKG